MNQFAIDTVTVPTHFSAALNWPTRLAARPLAVVVGQLPSVQGSQGSLPEICSLTPIEPNCTEFGYQYMIWYRCYPIWLPLQWGSIRYQFRTIMVPLVLVWYHPGTLGTSLVPSC